jgi:hypothetical protein
MLSLQKINNEKVLAIPVPTIDKSKIKGHELFDEIYPNVALIAKKKSGKTNCIYKILQKCSNKKTKIIIFAATVHKDYNWLAITKYFQDKGIHIETYTSIFDEDGDNLLQELLNTLGIKEEEQEKPVKQKSIIFDNEEKEEKEYKPKKAAPEYIVVFDDMSSDLSNKYINVLLKQNRQYKMQVIISTQYYNDIPKAGRQQIDAILLFPKIPLERLEIIYPELDLSIPYATFLKCYQYATKDKYNFLYVDTRDEQLRKNFNQKFIIKNM